MKKGCAILLAMLLMALPLVATGCSSGETVLNVYNWGEYIDMSVLDQFTEETGIKVKYSTFTSNEEMYAKVKSGGGNYDILVPSDYMIERLIQNDLLAELNYDNIPNASLIMDQFKGMAFDPNDSYSVPYMWGTVGILYNTALLPEGTVIDSWDALWNPEYKNQILMYDSSRDSIMCSLSRLGYDINTRNPEEVEAAAQALIEQKPLVLAYALDDVQDKMIAGEAALALVYSGYVINAMAENEDLAYCIPKEGSNIWLDSMVIPKSSKNKEAAEKFIDFMCRTDIAKKNVEYIGYSTPQQETFDQLPEDMQNNPVAYPDEDSLARCEVFNDLGDFNEVYDDAWIRIKAD
jgi:spermidine/putrescine transport system substrate-binding protein